MQCAVFSKARAIQREDDWQLIEKCRIARKKAHDCVFEPILMPGYHVKGDRPVGSRSSIFAAMMDRASFSTTDTCRCIDSEQTGEQICAALEVILRALQDSTSRAKGEEVSRRTEHTSDALTEKWICTWCLYGSPEPVVEQAKSCENRGSGKILCGTLTGRPMEENLRARGHTIGPVCET
ncbi:hypothetical protein [uncultured Croceicoccus sp.]|uniref:hypothetical protein n=1 Tax=uncultured Croceicoccus sp. TaxID=1295329 RepID=UPI00261363A2|nr:hypothetical protein [uncultured Croceicoccus sp.]